MKIFAVFMFLISATHADKIVGGTDARGPISYQVRLQYETGSIRCGGTLIHQNWVMSAAHCQGRPNEWSTWKLAFGYYDGLHEGVHIHEIADQIAHPEYNSGTTDNDVMVLKTHGTVLLSNSVQVAALPMHYEGLDLPEYGSPCIVSGWGTTSSGGTVSKYLQEVTVYVVPNAECNIPYTGSITTGMMCLEAPGKDSCQGDSGGPALCGNTVSGIVSWGIGCALDRFPGVYTRVSRYVNWIVENTDITM
ncbi:trypsin-like [Styela clava]|uniref:trypsin alpha-3-like n=1 Tax=Styela clava TaxID=7725 RepID=UPI00193A27B5|nr:trypsin alpha-3-like [Styela clava]